MHNKDSKIIKKSDSKSQFLEIFKDTHSSDMALDRLMNELWPKYKTPDSKERERVRPQIVEESSKLLVAYDLESHYALGQTFQKDYSFLVVEFCKNIIKEYNCQTPSEKALAEVAANGFVRYLRVARKLDIEWQQTQITSLKNTYISLLSKELDRAMRTYITAITTIRQIKNPLSKIKVEANTAFIGLNQQINVTPAKENNDVK